MSDAATSIFECSACRKHYKWKPEIAGKKVKCKCGTVIHIPATDPAPKPVAVAVPEEDNSLAALEEMATAKHVEVPRADIPPRQDDLYGIAETEKPKPRRAVPVNEGVGLAAAAAAPSPVLGYSRAPVAVERDDNDPNALKELYLPIGVFVVGLGLSLLHLTKLGVITFPFTTALAFIGVRLFFDMILICAGCLAVMGWLEISFGSPGPALLKIAGIALIAAPIASIVSYLVHDPFGIIGIIIGMVVIWILFMKLFDMDIADVRVLTAIVGLVRLWAGYALLALIFSGMGVSFAGMGGRALADAELNNDRLVQDKIDLGRMSDATQWIQDGAHCFGKTPNVISKKLANGLADAGCTSILVDHDGPFASQLVAKLPGKDAQRKAAFDAAKDYCDATGDTPPVDKGQTYLDMEFSMFYDPPTSAPSGAGAPGSTPRPRVYRRGRIRPGPMNSF